jgi:hypothetical protein
MSDTWSKIEIINHARYLAALNTVGSTAESEEPDEKYYNLERVRLLNEAWFEFSKKTIEVSSMSMNYMGYFALPKDFLKAYCPTIADRQGRMVKLNPNNGFCYNGTHSGATFTYIAKVTDTELFEDGYIDALTTGMAMRYTVEKAGTDKYQILLNEHNRVLKPYIEAEGSNTPLRVYR